MNLYEEEVKMFVKIRHIGKETSSCCFLLHLIFWHVIFENISQGICCMRLSAGLSIVRARTTNVPTISFTHSIWSAANGTLPAEMAVTMLILEGSPAKIVFTESVTREEMVAVSWNCVNICMLLYMPLPHLIALAIEVKLSSEMIISNFSFTE